MRVMGIPPGLRDAVGDAFGRHLVCGPLGFGHPRLGVRAKSQDAPVSRPVLDQLVVFMQHGKDTR